MAAALRLAALEVDQPGSIARYPGPFTRIIAHLAVHVRAMNHRKESVVSPASLLLLVPVLRAAIHAKPVPAGCILAFPVLTRLASVVTLTYDSLIHLTLS